MLMWLYCYVKVNLKILKEMLPTMQIVKIHIVIVQSRVRLII